jgi:hypothetical protein
MGYRAYQAHESKAGGKTMFQSLNLADIQRVQSGVVAIGLLTFVCVGVAACFALVAAAFFLVVQFFLIVLQAIVETFSCIGALWAGADPFVKLVLLVALVYGVYRFYQFRKGRKHA